MREEYRAEDKKEFSMIRTGKANPSILNNVQVEYWGMMTPLIQVGTISVPEARTLIIQPWDTTIVKDIEKAIQIFGETKILEKEQMLKDKILDFDHHRTFTAEKYTKHSFINVTYEE